MLVKIFAGAAMAGALLASAQADDSYILPLAAHWQATPLISVGEKASNGYAMAGVPDGLGAFDNADGTLTVLMNHELQADKGAVRAHGARGGFVSRWSVRLQDLSVVEGSDLVRKVFLWDAGSVSHRQAENVAFGRFCSADLAAASAFLDDAGDGFEGLLLLNGEEEKDLGGRAFAHVASGALAGTSYELPHLGRVAWENLLALPQSGKRTVVVGMDDHPGGHVYVYVGEKRKAGNPAEQAGLVGGKLYAVRFEGERFALVALGEVVGLDGKALRKRAKEAGATPLLRPEDGAWDKLDRNLFWFATTDKIDGQSQLFRMAFDDSRMPEKGGRVSVALTARDIGGQMFDNIAVDGAGRVLIDEDPGDNKFAAGIWMYDPRNPGTAVRLFDADPERFAQHEHPRFMTEDEEQSGILEVTEQVRSAPWFDPSRRYYLGVAQAHKPHPDPALVEYGQLYLISGPAR